MGMFGVRRLSVLRMCSQALLAAVLLGSSTPAVAQLIERVSVDSSGAQGNNPSHWAAISADGRYVAFDSSADNLVTGDNNSARDVFIHDRQTRVTERVSVSSSEDEGTSDSWNSSISSDGRYVAFLSEAGDLVDGDTNGFVDVFIRDRQEGVTERVSVSSAEVEGNFDCFYRPSISADGNFVAFTSGADNLVVNDENATSDIFVRDRQAGATERVSLDSDEVEGKERSLSPSISADGRYVAFVSLAGNLVEGDANYVYDIFVRDRQTGVTERVSLDSDEVGGNEESDRPSISADGRYVAFDSWSTNLVPGVTSGLLQIFLRDRQAGVTEWLSMNSAGVEGNGGSLRPSVSADGAYVAFDSSAGDLVAGDGNGTPDVFVRNRLTGMTERVSVNSIGVEGNFDSVSPSISADGRLVAFMSSAANFGDDTNNVSDIFVRIESGLIFSNGFEEVMK